MIQSSDYSCPVLKNNPNPQQFKSMKMNENENAKILSAFENRLRAGFV